MTYVFRLIAGRTGTAICSWLIANGQFEQARVSTTLKIECWKFPLWLTVSSTWGIKQQCDTDLVILIFFQQSLEFFGFRRTDYNIGKTYQGVQTPSQVQLISGSNFLNPIFWTDKLHNIPWKYAKLDIKASLFIKCEGWFFDNYQW